MGVGGIMICRDIGYYGKLEMKFITKELNSEKYIETIDEQMHVRYKFPEINTFFNVRKQWNNTLQIKKFVL